MRNPKRLRDVAVGRPEPDDLPRIRHINPCALDEDRTRTVMHIDFVDPARVPDRLPPLLEAWTSRVGLGRSLRCECGGDSNFVKIVRHTSLKMDINQYLENAKRKRGKAAGIMSVLLRKLKQKPEASSSLRCQRFKY